MVIQQNKNNGVAVKDSKKHVHGDHGAGDDDDHSCASSDFSPRVFPENVHKRLQAMRNLHLDVQKIKAEFDLKMMQVEAEYQKKMEPLFKKRAQIVSGTYEPAENESKFQLKEGSDEAPETLPADAQAKGVPKFWVEVLTRHSLTTQIINPEVDTPVLEYLTDVRVIYTDKPMGYRLEFEFADNPFFENKVLSRSYEFNAEIPREEMYYASHISPRVTSGTEIKWKDGKNLTKKTVTATQRNKKTGERRTVTREEKQDTFFTFFTPTVTDLAVFTKNFSEKDAADEEIDEETEQKMGDIETDYEVANALRTRIIPRAVLIYTGEEEDDMYSDEEDFDDDEDDEEGDESDDNESDESEPEPPAKKGKSSKK